MRYPGQLYDSESGLHYNYFRDYEAATGTYVKSDPIGLRGGVTTYSYVDGAPMTGYDTRGLFNPNKLSTSLLSALNSLRLGLASGVTTIASVFSGGMGSEETGALLMGKAIWNFRSSSVAMKKSLQFGCEAFNQDLSQMSFKNFLGLVPFGQNFDDTNEPEPWEWLKSEAQDKDWVEWVEELGTAGT